METIDVTYDIGRPPEEVFAVLTDFAALKRWRTVEAIELSPPGPARVGTRVVTTVMGMGRPMEFASIIEELDPLGYTFRDRADGGFFLLQSRWRIERTPTGSQIHWTTEFEVEGFLKLGTSIIDSSIRKGLLDDFAKLKHLLEAPASGTAA